MNAVDVRPSGHVRCSTGSDRWVFGLVGPASFGTWVSAAVRAAVGMGRRGLFAWLVVGATVWTGLLVLASDSLLGWLFG